MDFVSLITDLLDTRAVLSSEQYHSKNGCKYLCSEMTMWELCYWLWGTSMQFFTVAELFYIPNSRVWVPSRPQHLLLLVFLIPILTGEIFIFPMAKDFRPFSCIFYISWTFYLSFTCMSVLLAHMSLHHVRAVPMEARRHQIFWDCSYTQLYTTSWMLAMEPRSSVRGLTCS